MMLFSKKRNNSLNANRETEENIKDNVLSSQDKPKIGHITSKMVIHEENDAPCEVANMKRLQSEKKKYIIVKNHVRELSVNEEKVPSGKFSQEKSPELHKYKKKKCKKSSKKRENEESTSHSESDPNTDTNITEMSQSDLEELKAVYKKCKDVLNRIESKYGHLLDLDYQHGSRRHVKGITAEVDTKCTCSANKKIIFDENGEQILKESELNNHVCPNKLKRRHSTTCTDNRNVQIEYEDHTSLPDDLPSLANILQDSTIEITHRNTVINKIKAIKLEYTNQIKFDKPFLIDKLKSNSEEILDFKGTNLLSLPGYPLLKK